MLFFLKSSALCRLKPLALTSCAACDIIIATLCCLFNKQFLIKRFESDNTICFVGFTSRKIKNLSRGFDTHGGPVSMGKEKENKYRGIDRNVGKQAGKNDKEDDEGCAP